MTKTREGQQQQQQQQQQDTGTRSGTYKFKETSNIWNYSIIFKVLDETILNE